ncbi:MAG: protocatechuate 3,4-dioxygenase subunit alpha [Actinomycetes bacterium]
MTSAAAGPGSAGQPTRLAPTPSQTIGPFFSHALPWPDGPWVVAEEHPDAVVLTGRVFDGAGVPVPDALVETWQADPEGRYAHPEDAGGAQARPGFRAFGRCPTDPEGRYRIVTVKPGRVPGPGGVPQAPHIAVSVFARGLLDRVVTRVYFPDEAEANASDPVLASLQDDAAWATLVAVAEPGGLRFDVHLQGEHETAFLAV